MGRDLEPFQHFGSVGSFGPTAYGVTGDLSLAEDAASEAFYAALDSLQDLRDTQRFGKTNANTKIYFFTNFVQWL